MALINIRFYRIYPSTNGIYDKFRVPLFLIESFVNLTGYFVIRFAVGEGLKKWREPLDMGFYIYSGMDLHE